MSLGDVLGQLFYGTGVGLSTYKGLKDENDERTYRRKRDALEDELHAEANQRAWKNEAREASNVEYQRGRDRQADFVKQFEDAGIKGSLSAFGNLRKAAGNQVQTGTGVDAATDANNLLPTALASLQQATSSKGFDPQKQSDLGNGLYFQGADFGKRDLNHRIQKFVGKDGKLKTIDLDTMEVTDTGQDVRDLAQGNTVMPEYDPTTGLPHLTVVRKSDATSTPVKNSSGNVALAAGAMPTNEERVAKGQYDTLAPLVDELDAAYKATGYKSPSFGQSIAMGKVREGGLIAKNLANTYLANKDKRYQNIGRVVNALNAQITYLMSGKAINETEGRRLLNIVESIASDPPEQVMAKINEARTIIESQKVRAGRALNQGAAPFSFAEQGQTTPQFRPENPYTQ